MTGLDWTHPVRDIPADGLRVERQADAHELKSLAPALDVLEVVSLKAEYRLKPAGVGRYRLSGAIDAHLVQACVVSLDPVRTTVTGPLDALFCAPGAEPEATDDAGDIDAPDVEPLAGGIIEIGRIVYEELVSGIDPFPRLADASLEQSSTPEAPLSDHPFAALARLRRSKPDA